MPCAACQGKSQGFQRVNDSPTRPVQPVSSNPTRACYSCSTKRESRNEDFMLTYKLRQTPNQDGRNGDLNRNQNRSLGATDVLATSNGVSTTESNAETTVTSDTGDSNTLINSGETTNGNTLINSSDIASEKINSSFDPRDYVKEADALSGDDENSFGFMVPLNEKNFDSTIRSHASFVKFFVPQCGHCLRLKPLWEKLASTVDSSKVTIAELDCKQHGNLCDREKINGYPSLILYKNGQKAQEYEGKRTVQEMMAFINKHV